jgi:hypothetical protein
VTVLRLRPVAGSDLDRAMAVVEGATLVRSDAGAFIEVPVADAGRLVRALAFVGIAATSCDADLSVPRALRPAVGRDLAPLASGAVSCDMVRIRRLTLGEATRELLRRRFGGLAAPTEAARQRVRAVLRGEDVVLAWSRQGWATADALRTPRVRASLRPVVFDRGALERSDLPGRTLASAGSLSRWLFA